MDLEKTAAYLEQEEGYRPHVYRCTSGALTIGIGYNLDGGMPHDEAQMAGVEPPGRIAQASLTLFGWPAWWGGKKYRDKCAADQDHTELHGDYGND